ncbi:glycosyl hydrolase family 18 protein [Metabacillus sp. RGM 3146]|uniref:glycosyl hydrolase family 18 protein n=1 Tax=Metabacillus sp. RGM 3146 TaxID=3401092 RepID=UPI003B99C1AF
MKKLSCIMLIISFLLTGCGGSMGKAGKDPGQGSNNQAGGVNPHPRVNQISTKTKKPSEVNPTDTEYKKQKIETIGFLEPVDPTKAVTEIKNTGKLLSYTAFFSYRAKKDGSLIPLNDAAPLAAARKTGTAPMMVLTNFTESNFSPDVAHSIFTNKAVSDKLIKNVLIAMQTKGYKALNIDFEHIKQEDRELYNGFLETMIPKLHDKGYLVSTALAPKTSDKQAGPWHGAHDYKKHGELADFVILMTYEWGWSGGPPMAVSPILQVRKVVDYALSVIPKEKIVMGAPLYGYDWTLPYKKGNPSAKRIAPEEAESLAYKKGAEIKFDNKTQSPYYYYKDAAGKSHVVWFENQQSAQAKFEQLKDFKLRGIAYWVLGEPFPENWSLLKEQFQIRHH